MKTLIVKSKCRNCDRKKSMAYDIEGDFEANHPHWQGCFYAMFANKDDMFFTPTPFVSLDKCDCDEGFILHDIISYSVK
jgi:hypothetical protein